MSNAMQTIGEGVGLGFAAAFRHKAEKACKQGASHLENGKTEEAVACFTQAIRHDPSFTQARLNRAVALSAAGRFAKAVEDADEVIREEPANAEAFLMRAVALAAWGQQSNDPALIGKAEQDLSEAGRLNPQYNNIKTSAVGQSGQPTEIDWSAIGRGVLKVVKFGALVGLGALVLIGGGTKICPFCKTQIPGSAMKCPNCLERPY